MMFDWSKIAQDPDFVGYENDNFLYDKPTYYFKSGGTATTDKK